jgi:homocysteine S-methyltransferase
MQNLLNRHSRILMEGAIVERVRRDGEIRLHPTLLNAPLIYDTLGRHVLANLYRGYIEIALNHNLPFVMSTPTWRANRERTHEAAVPATLNRDAADFMRQIRKGYGEDEQLIRIGGLMGCKNDCYRPEEALSTKQARNFHAWQIAELAAGGVDFLLAQTLPSVEEALGIAQAMSDTGLPYCLSFVIGHDGKVLDGTSLSQAFQHIDAESSPPPIGFMVNCAYPTFLCAERQPSWIFKRLLGYLANASSIDQCELDQAESLQADDITDWGEAMIELNTQYGVSVLGGCCGTSEPHIRYLAAHLSVAPLSPTIE